MKRLAPQQTAVIVANLLNLLRHDFKNFSLEQLRQELIKRNCPFIVAIIPVLTSRGFIVKSNKYYNFAITHDFVSDYFVQEIESCQKTKHRCYKNKLSKTSNAVEIKTTPIKKEVKLESSEEIHIDKSFNHPKEINITIGNVTIIIKQ